MGEKEKGEKGERAAWSRGRPAGCAGDAPLDQSKDNVQAWIHQKPCTPVDPPAGHSCRPHAVALTHNPLSGLGPSTGTWTSGAILRRRCNAPCPKGSFPSPR